MLPCLLGMVPATILAIKCLRRLRTQPGRGRGLAIAALVLSAAWTGVLVAMLVLPGPQRPEAHAFDSTGEATGPVVPGNTSVGDLHPGDCIGSAPAVDTLAYEVDVVPCSRPHREEVFAVYELPAGPFPGAARAGRQSEDGCRQRSTAYVGSPLGATPYQLVTGVPAPEDWRLDRTVTCMLESGSPVTGSARG
jgi:hypothetical protein